MSFTDVACSGPFASIRILGYTSKHHDPDPSRTRNTRGSQPEVRPRTQALSDASTERSCLGRVYLVAAGKDSFQVVLGQAELGSLV